MNFHAGLLAAPLALLALLATGCASSESRPAEEIERGRILLVLTNHGRLGETGKPTGLYISEAAHPHAVFTEAGYEVVLASPRGGPAPVDPRSTRELDAESRDFLSRFASSGAVRDTLPLYRVNPDEYEAIFFAGGHGAMWDFPEDDAVQNVAEQIYANGGVIGAVCHGPAALVNMNAPDGSPLVKDRRVAAFTNEEEAAVELTDVMPFLLETRLREQGARFIPAANFTENVVTDGTLVTGQNPASARAAAEAVVRTLRSGE